jgi:hypothetical protein
MSKEKVEKCKEPQRRPSQQLRSKCTEVPVALKSEMGISKMLTRSRGNRTSPVTVDRDIESQSEKQKTAMPKKKSQVIKQQAIPAMPSMTRNYNGPITQTEVKKIMAELIHSPHQLQIETAKHIEFQKVVPRTDLSVTSLKAEVDATALSLLPTDIPSVQPLSFPIVIEGDGNCLSRCGSILAYGSPAYHMDIRLRIAVELILHRELYLQTDYLSRGLPDGQVLTAKCVAQFSDEYQGQKLDKPTVEKILQAEIHQVLKPKEYMGLWQLMALASVLKQPITSVYPMRGNPSVRRDMHRVILPREALPLSKQAPACIMWTSARNDMNERNWVPNHFCLVLPMLCQRKEWTVPIAVADDTEG